MARAAGPERRLLAVYTGGTIGMRSERGVLVPGRGLAAVLRTLPMFHDKEHAQARGLPEDTLVLPPASGDQRIVYTVLECQPLFDSSDMTIAEWVQIAQTIESHYDQYHGFVVIHGTDTMAFAASVLSFVLENLRKTVVLTGAQVPIHALWSDGRENLLGALLMAGLYVIPEVCLFFQNQLFRGNRVTKVDSRRFAAFCSPNLRPLAVVGADVTINQELVRRPRGPARLVVHSGMEQDVGLLRLYPGIPASLVRAFLRPPLKGVVLETFGSGNGPTKPELLQELRAAAARGLLILNCTHCLQGAVTSDYAAGAAMAGVGIVSGFDMTSEAALAKLSYVLGRPGLSPEGRKELLARDLRGEVTLPLAEGCQAARRGGVLGCQLAQLLSLSQEAGVARDALVPSLACAAAHAGDLEALQALAELDSDLRLEDFRGQTPLHVAARGGHAGVVTMLLQRGADANARDEDGLSPLLLAVRGRHRGVISLLRAAGACLSPQELEDVGTELCRLASRADGEGLRAWCQAGADPGLLGYDGRSALHVAEAAGDLEVLALLQSLQGGADARDPGPVGGPGGSTRCPGLLSLVPRPGLAPPGSPPDSRPGTGVPALHNQPDSARLLGRGLERLGKPQTQPGASSEPPVFLGGGLWCPVLRDLQPARAGLLGVEPCSRNAEATAGLVTDTRGEPRRRGAHKLAAAGTRPSRGPEDEGLLRARPLSSCAPDTAARGRKRRRDLGAATPRPRSLPGRAPPRLRLGPCGGPGEQLGGCLLGRVSRLLCARLRLRLMTIKRVQSLGVTCAVSLLLVPGMVGARCLTLAKFFFFSLPGVPSACSAFS
ncbi:60 kDa lysophospholipase [Talpa occidentalis]|uniref:60 kDa lysophospholipase n=1 Tax=Talpa occidentalis TaxID=50954 RepID=UPI0018907B68|nr:60 kDa lysophospholipase [Talpa occidentalis]